MTFQQILDSEARLWFDGGMTESKKDTTYLAAVMDDILDVLILEEGPFVREPGQVLRAMAEITGHDYFTVSHAVLRLERIGLVEVERWSHREAQRANKLVSIRLAD